MNKIKCKKHLRKPFKYLISVFTIMLVLFTGFKIATVINPAYAYLTDKSIFVEQLKTGTWNYSLTVDAGGVNVAKMHDYGPVYRIGTWRGKQGVTLLDYQETGTVINLPTPILQGYTFTGWTADKNNKGKLNGTSSYTIKTESKDKITANWKPNTNTKYTVIHRLQKIDGTLVTQETQNLTGTTDTDVTPATKKYYGYTTPAKQTKTIKPDGSTSFTYIYKATSDKSEIQETFTTPTLKKGDNVFTKDVKIKNTSSDNESIADYARVFMDFSSRKARNTSYLSSDDGKTWYSVSDYKNHLPAGWVYVEDGTLGGYYYYTNRINPGSSTTSLFNKVKTVSDGNLESFDIYVYSETTKDMDSNNNKFNNYEAAWNARLGG